MRGGNRVPDMTETSFQQSNKFSTLESPVSVQMSRPLWISSPSREVKESLPFLTWIIFYRCTSGNSWLPQQGAVPSVIYRAGGKWSQPSCPIVLNQTLLELSPRLLIVTGPAYAQLRLRSSFTVMGQHLWVTIWQWSNLSSHLWPHLLHVPIKPVMNVSLLSILLLFTHKPYEGHWLQNTGIKRWHYLAALSLHATRRRKKFSWHKITRS